MFRFELVVTPVVGARDPQAEAVTSALAHSDFSSVRADVVGRYLRFSVQGNGCRSGALAGRQSLSAVSGESQLETYSLRLLADPPAVAAERATDSGAGGIVSVRNPIKAAVIVFPGSNGDRDLYEALCAAGLIPVCTRDTDDIPGDVALCGPPGGFPYGDYWRAGVLASRARAVRRLASFHASGGLVIGICNGFQILAEAGYLRGALTYNTPPRFVHRFVTVVVRETAERGPWFSTLPVGTKLTLPIAHAEGAYRLPKMVIPSAADSLVLRTQPQRIAAFDAAAVSDETGRILGIMPHPERAIDLLLGSQDGLCACSRVRSDFFAAGTDTMKKSRSTKRCAGPRSVST